MKYLEELTPGECFEHKQSFFVLTHDFKKNGERLCIQLENGFVKWMASDAIVNITDLFTMDKDNNIIAIKERQKNDSTNQNKNIS